MMTDVKIAPDRLGGARADGIQHIAFAPCRFRICAWQRLNSLTAALRQYLPIIAIPVVCRFSDAGMAGLSTRSSGRRPKSAKARNRGMWAAAVPRLLWGFGHKLGCACDDAKRERDLFCRVGGR